VVMCSTILKILYNIVMLLRYADMSFCHELSGEGTICTHISF